MMGNETLNDIMTHHIDRVEGTLSVQEASRRMSESEISCLVVGSPSGISDIRGIFTERDVLHCVTNGIDPETPLETVMNSPVYTVPLSLGVREAFQNGLRLGVRHQVVLDPRKKPVGIITDTDFAHSIPDEILQSLGPVTRVANLRLTTVPQDFSLLEAMRRMERDRIGCVLVLQEERLAGILTLRDVVRLFGEGSDLKAPVKTVMTFPVISVPASTPVSDSIRKMKEYRIRHLVVEGVGGRAIGILDEHDFLLRVELEDLSEEVARRQKSEMELSHVIESVQDSVFLLNAEGELLYLNQAGRTLLQIQGTEKEPVRLHEFVEEPGSRILLLHRERIRRGARLRKECTLRLRNGDRVDLEVSAQPLGTGRILTVARDVTERKKNEARMLLAATVFENAFEGIIITDRQARIIEVNNSFETVTGYNRTEVLGKNPRILQSGRHDRVFYESFWEHLSRAGYWRGEMWNRRKSGELYAAQMTISSVRDEEGEITQYVGIFTDVTPIKEKQEQIDRLAHYDSLTHLPNRILFADRIEQALARTKRDRDFLAVVYMDVDNFKGINDRYGHDTGDRLLILLSERLRDCIREGDTVSRPGGDEFVLLLNDLSSREDCEQALERILRKIQLPLILEDREFHFTASLGVSLYPVDDCDADTLMRHADQAMFKAKQSGRNRYHFFDADQDRIIQARSEAVFRIEEALNKEEFLLYYQPRVDMKRGKILGAEALIRWNHPEKGLLPPGEFLPLIQESDLAIRIGEWVLIRAMEQLSLWWKEGYRYSVSVNIDAHHLQSRSFVLFVKHILLSYPEVPPEALELEVLETGALEDMNRVSRVIHDCHKLGVRFALDDFGTGYSSLTYFRRLPVDVLKIDRSFVIDMLYDENDLAIVEGVIGLTRAFSRQVIAEGVESIEHGQLLLKLGCHLGQGYGIAHPMPVEKFNIWADTYQFDPSWLREETSADFIAEATESAKSLTEEPL